MKISLAAAILAAALAACSSRGPTSQTTPTPAASGSAFTLPIGTQSLQVDVYVGTFTDPVPPNVQPYFTTCTAVPTGAQSVRAAAGAPPGADTLVSTAHAGPCTSASSPATGAIIARGFGTGTVVAGANNDIATVFGSGAVNLVPI